MQVPEPAKTRHPVVDRGCARSAGKARRADPHHVIRSKPFAEPEHEAAQRLISLRSGKIGEFVPEFMDGSLLFLGIAQEKIQWLIYLAADGKRRTRLPESARKRRGQSRDGAAWVNRALSYSATRICLPCRNAPTRGAGRRMHGHGRRSRAYRCSSGYEPVESSGSADMSGLVLDSCRNGENEDE